MTKKNCVVTGATKGIGRAIAKMLAEEGYGVTICGRTQAGVDDAVQQLRAETGGKVAGKAADVRNHKEVAALFEFVDREFDGLDVLVNNAGLGVFRPVDHLTVEDWQLTLETNLSGVFYCCREAFPRFQTRGGGYIVNISSLAGKNAFAGGSAYNASKFGLNGFSEAMMLDKRYENVRVSYIMPGSVGTGFSREAAEFSGHNPDSASDWKIQPEDIAEIVKSLLSMPERTLITRIEVRPSKPKK